MYVFFYITFGMAQCNGT